MHYLHFEIRYLHFKMCYFAAEMHYLHFPQTLPEMFPKVKYVNSATPLPASADACLLLKHIKKACRAPRGLGRSGGIG